MKRYGLLLTCVLALHPVARPQMGCLTDYRRSENSVFLSVGSMSLAFRFVRDDIVCVQFLPTPEAVFDSSVAVVQQGGAGIPLEVSETDTSVTISSPSMTLRCRKCPFHVTYLASSGSMLLEDSPSGGFTAHDAGRKVAFVLNRDTHLYGTGERSIGLDLRGNAFDSYNTQVGGYSSPLPTMNLNIPFVASSGGCALFFENASKGRFDLGASDSSVLSYTTSSGELAYYLIEGKTIREQLDAYTWLTGRQPLPPRWAFGYIQSKNRYGNEAEARSIVDTLRKEDIPCDAIVLDLAWFDRMGDLQWNRSAWPDPEAMMSGFLGRGIKTILITEPYVVEGSANFSEGDSRGFFSRDSEGRTYSLDRWWSCTGCRAALVDLTNPQAREWWWSKYEMFLGKQVAGVWTDLGEPERHPADMVHSLGPASAIHNIYNLLWAKTVFEGFTRFRPGERLFNLTRSGYAGIQRYGVIPWSGDVARSFGGLSVQIPLLLNTGMSGLGYLNSDIGGYSRIPTTPELYVRWMEFGAFSPIMRAHGAGEAVKGSPTEPWRFGQEAEQICREYIRLRYRLLPYIYTIARENSLTGMPLVRPLLMMDPEDSRLTNDCSSFLLGDALLISPVVQSGQSSKDVYLPGGKWYDFWSDSVVEGRREFHVPAPLDRIPLFVRAGSILPMAPDMSYSDQHPLDTLGLAVYPDERGRASFTLYEDDGKSLLYQEGRYSVTSFSASRSGGAEAPVMTLALGGSKGGYAGKPSVRTYRVEIHGIRSRPGSVRVNGSPVREDPALRTGFHYDARRSLLRVSLTCVNDSGAVVTVGPGRRQ